MARQKRHNEKNILSITKAAQKLEIEPDHLRYLVRIAIRDNRIKPAPRSPDMDKRCKYFDFGDLLSIVPR